MVGKHPRAYNRNAKWSKVAWLIEMLQRHEIVLWVDADAWLAQPTCPQRWFDPLADIGMAADVGEGTWVKHGGPPTDRFNTGVIALRRSALDLLRVVLPM